jgi:hypothetical protein
MIKHSMEWNEILGDMMYDVSESEARIEVHEAIAVEQELTGADLDDWYASIIRDHENYEDHKDKV